MTTMIEVALRYAARGWPVLPCRPRTKVPLTRHGSKDAVTDADTIRQWWRQWPEANVGVATGTSSGLYVIDEDDGGAETIAALDLPETYTVRTPNGGRHYYFALPEGVELPNSAKTKLGPGVDTRGRGGYVCAPPSVVNGRPYAVEVDAEVAPLPQHIIDRLLPKARPSAPIRVNAPPNSYAEAALRGEVERVARAPEGTRNDTLNRSAFRLGQFVGAGLLSEDRVISDLQGAAQLAGLPWSESELTITSGLTAGKVEPLHIPEREPRTRAQQPTTQPIHVNVEHMEVRQKRHRATPAVLFEVLGGDRVLTDSLALSVHEVRPVFLSAPPWYSEGPYPRPMEDLDVFRACVWLEIEMGLLAGKDNMGFALHDLASRRKFDPVGEYLCGVSWDGVDRLSTWVQRYLGAPDTLFHRAAGRAWCISAVARALSPGCKVDTVLVLEGRQGLGKSRALRALAGDSFSDAMPDMRSKDSLMLASRSWIHELGELAALSRGEIEDIKRFISAQADEFRAPYAKEPAKVPRRCVFAASTNQHIYLRDQTGGRRFWPMPCSQIDVAGIQRDRDQLWAEAVAAYRAGEPWHLAPEIEALAAEEQEARAEPPDPWAALLGDMLEGLGEVTVEECARRLKLSESEMNDRTSGRIARVLTGVLGWAVVRRRTGEGEARRRIFVRKESDGRTGTSGTPPSLYYPSIPNDSLSFRGNRVSHSSQAVTRPQDSRNPADPISSRMSSHLVPPVPVPNDTVSELWGGGDE